MPDPRAEAAEEEVTAPAGGGPRYVHASSNPAKRAEVAALLAGRLRLVEPSPALPEVAETAGTLLENALLKARSAVAATGLPALADDTALDVRALDGRPGIETARYAQRHGGYGPAIDALLAELDGSADRSAAFRCCAVCVMPDGREVSAEAELAGTILISPSGAAGFGFDSVFAPDGAGASLADLPDDEYMRLSHRAAAFRRLVATLSRD